jgi:hypothetical protein
MPKAMMHIANTERLTTANSRLTNGTKKQPLIITQK